MNNNENILNIDVFTKLIRTAQDFINFESHKTLFLHDPHLFTRQKSRYA